MKYSVESRTIVSKMVGTPGSLSLPDILAATRMIKNARRSMLPQYGECGM